jgi:creatinine amidohydrolase
MKYIKTLIFVHCSLLSLGQVYSFKELTTFDVKSLDLARTAVIIPGGLIEEHGPYLPLYTDGYTNEALAKKVADSIFAELNFKVLIFPTIPLGVGSPETFAGIQTYPGVVYLKPSTLRLLFMDIADMLGRQGFKWIFVIFKHGDKEHNEVLNQACDYFAESYDGKMVTLTALEYDTWKGKLPPLSPGQIAENGIDIHAGMDETSRMLFNFPSLVKSNYVNATPMPAQSWNDFPRLTESAAWKGYYGSPRLATKEYGQSIMNKFSHNLSELAIKIISGYDHRQLKKLGEKTNAAERGTVTSLTDEIDLKQKKWLKKKGIE